MAMLLAGEDTTANTLGWAVHQLCDSPESVMELRREADELLGTSDVAGDIETANKLAFTGAVANETIRLRPVGPVLLLEAKVDTVVGDLLVPKGTGVACSRVRRRAILITLSSPRPSGHAAGSANTPARTTYRRTFRLVRVRAFVPAAFSPCSR
jgi:Cytochrome P450